MAEVIQMPVVDAAEKKEKIVLLSANGKIGEETAKQLEKLIETAIAAGKEPEIWLAARENKKARPGEENPAEGIIRTLRAANPRTQKHDLAAICHEFIWDRERPELSEQAMTAAGTILCTGGMPRKLNKDGSNPPRDQVLLQNAELGEDVGTITGRYAPAEAIIITNTNPANNLGKVIEDARNSELEKRGITPDRIPAHNEVVMGGSLDENRVLFITEDYVNALLQGSEKRVISSQVDAKVLGQHGDAMVVTDIMVKGEKLEDYLSDRNISESTVELVKGLIERDVIDEGARQSRLTGHSVTYEPALEDTRIAEAIIRTRATGEKEIITMGVRHAIPGVDDREIFSSVPTVIEGGKVVGPDPEYLERIRNDPELSARVVKSRDAILNVELNYELTKTLIAKEAAYNIEKTENGHNIRLEIKNLSDAEADRIQYFIEQTMKISPENITRNGEEITFITNEAKAKKFEKQAFNAELENIGQREINEAKAQQAYNSRNAILELTEILKENPGYVIHKKAPMDKRQDPYYAIDMQNGGDGNILSPEKRDETNHIKALVTEALAIGERDTFLNRMSATLNFTPDAAGSETFEAIIKAAGREVPLLTASQRQAGIGR